MGAAPLGTGEGRFDSAVATLADGRRVVVRVPTDEPSAIELGAETRALNALTPGVRAALGFAAPEILGVTTLGGSRATVSTYLPGYRVDAADIPPGPGAATSIAASLACIHDLPSSVVRDAGLPVRTSAQVRDDAERLLDRAEATGRLPFGLLRRWSTALGTEDLWRFETTVVLGGTDAGAFLLDDVDDVPTVTGVLGWHGLSVGDPAIDLRWVASATQARADLLGAYAQRIGRAPDDLLPERARLHAEFEFASWLVHGHTVGSDAIVADAVALLQALEENVRDEPPFVRAHVTADDAFAASGRVPSGASGPVDTSMQTDAYVADVPEAFADHEQSTDTGEATQPIDTALWTPRGNGASDHEGAGEGAGARDGDDHDPDTAARNALQRWTQAGR